MSTSRICAYIRFDTPLDDTFDQICLRKIKTKNFHNRWNNDCHYVQYPVCNRDSRFAQLVSRKASHDNHSSKLHQCIPAQSYQKLEQPHDKTRTTVHAKSKVAPHLQHSSSLQVQHKAKQQNKLYVNCSLPIQSRGDPPSSIYFFARLFQQFCVEEQTLQIWKPITKPFLRRQEIDQREGRGNKVCGKYPL